VGSTGAGAALAAVA